MCPECGGRNITPHMEWVDGKFRAGKSRCENCNNIFGPESEAAPVTRGRGRPRKEEIEVPAEEAPESEFE